VKVEGKTYRLNFYPNYDDAKENELFLIEGSCNTLEISLKNGNANNKLHIETGRRIEIY
jgi:S-adenosylmethionine hydrolase